MKFSLYLNRRATLCGMVAFCGAQLFISQLLFFATSFTGELRERKESDLDYNWNVKVFTFFFFFF